MALLLDWIEKEKLHQLARPSNREAWVVVVVNFALIALAFALPAIWHHPLAWVAASVLLAGRAQGMGILTHDSAHLAFFPSRKMNEWAGTWLFGSLPHIPYLAYRQGHLQHHRTAGTPQDPDLVFVEGYPATWQSMCRKALRDVSGLNGVKQLIYQVQSFRWASSKPFLLAHAILFVILYALGVPQVYACWWLGQVFVFPLLVRLRAMGEHGAVPNHFDIDPRRNTSTTLPGFFGRLLVGCNRVNFHIEHHLAAGMPSYRLPALHRHLCDSGFYKDYPALPTSYWQVIRRCVNPHAEQTVSLPRSKNQAKGIFNNMQ